jgi:RNA-directed DNA polymerase
MPTHRIRTVLDVASVVALPAQSLRDVARDTSRMYSPYMIAKRSGGMREIARPNKELKALQRRLLHELFAVILPPRTRWCIVDTVQNAATHLQQPNIVALDLRDAFPSTRAQLVATTLTKSGLNPAAAELITRLCTFRGALPQGAPTSDAILNAILHDVDLNIGRHCERRAIRYTRYADNFTLSAQEEIEDTVSFVVAQAAARSYSIPPAKILRGGGTVEIEVTGVIIAGDQTRASPSSITNARAALAEALAVPDDENLDSARGHLHWIDRVDPDAARRLREEFPLPSRAGKRPIVQSPVTALR